MKAQSFEQGEVLVYAFEAYDEASRDWQVALYKAPEAHIVSQGGRPLPGTAEAVPQEALDASGRYRRVATGWGALA